MSDLSTILTSDLPALIIGSLVLAVVYFLLRLIAVCLFRYGNRQPEEAGETFAVLVLLANAIVLLLALSRWIGRGFLHLLGVK